MPDFVTASVQDYLDRLASGEPTPGGGSAAGLTGAMGAALLCMSARFTVGREKFAAFQPEASKVLDEAIVALGDLQRLMEEDAAAYALYGAALKLPKATDDEKTRRRQAFQEAAQASALAPMAIARQSCRLLELAGALAENCNPNLVSDVVVAAHLALGAFRSAVINVRLNLRTITDADFVRPLAEELQVMVTLAPQLADAALTSAYLVMELPKEGDLSA